MNPTGLTSRRTVCAVVAGAFALVLLACEQKPSASPALRTDAQGGPSTQEADARQLVLAARPQPPEPSAFVAQTPPEPQATAPVPDKPEAKASVPKSPTAAGKPTSPSRPVGDAELMARVKSAVLAEPMTALLFNVSVSGGVVTLSGTADSAETRDKAARAAAAVEGVKSVNNKIAVISAS
jgi:hypothetical protein